MRQSITEFSITTSGQGLVEVTPEVVAWVRASARY